MSHTTRKVAEEGRENPLGSRDELTREAPGLAAGTGARNSEELAEAFEPAEIPGEGEILRGFLGGCAEEIPVYDPEAPHGRARDQGWSFWESHDIDLSPIYGQEDVERVYVEPGHPHAARRRHDGDAPFEVVIAEGPPSPIRADA